LSGEADEDFLDSVEVQVCDYRIIRDGEIVSFREGILDRAVKWLVSHPGVALDNHVGEIFGDVKEKLSRAIAEENEVKLLEFAACAPRYSQSEKTLIEDEKIPGLKDQTKRYREAEEKLLALGYPKATLALHIEWAFSDKMRKRSK
jgi:hypothetical protein